MKTLIITITLTLITSFGFAQFPQSSTVDSCCYVSKDIRAAIIDRDGSFVDVKIAKLPDEVVKIRIMDRNEVIHQTRIRKEEIVDLKFDFANYPEGKYTVEILKRNTPIISRVIDTTPENIALANK